MLLKRNFLLCLHADTNSLRLFKVAILGLQIIKYFSHKHKLHLFEAQLSMARNLRPYGRRARALLELQTLIFESFSIRNWKLY